MDPKPTGLSWTQRYYLFHQLRTPGELAAASLSIGKTGVLAGQT
ncbi:proline-rich receptor-like protein kinase PERK9 [Iris pallida]|uniref:Proline-rich receptor-like protein kinase PERK9 n=1 Tax=Iris pallida TaxID=29817 RepID=A0AAX6DW61_IRIPA|nr:proline-rich receptor-like protein kinase PERK9 [Iris pallida]